MLNSTHFNQSDPSSLLADLRRIILELEKSDGYVCDEVWDEAITFARREDLATRGISTMPLIMRYVREGEIKELNKLVPALADNFHIGKMSDDPLRQAKYSFVSFITLIARVAIEGGLDSETAMNLSDAYIQKIDISNDQHYIAQMTVQMVYDYTHRVEESRNADCYSALTKKCINYISKSLHYKISVAQMAEKCGVHRAYLSTRFKKDTGKSISDFITEKRILEAKSLLLYSDMTSLQISNHLSFSSPSSFASQFKKYTLLTPREYRNRHSSTSLL